ncbi:bifunctional sugar phosphate isomerase/epimerase/4-hydroxyphenylpyruvate dioxygenase family protein [Methylopila sp. Yamaguchi]|uniref:bifunctional sugar phosphate isomerase/epimerase/4-hydroxyphenylpyruvate dioxygenase family protein n=1 Tax=Methylopila sp. Yamaguchi TaxID=1437817 RepID=UPI000CB4F0FC|nr:sugar phosphate isomerase/epimerase and 4-hydroxyphenylpyruvate domain-containing protein [Methylopila sp. Yamaguchi]GBD48747.1 3-keto-5-aminohexanoate cleavage protein [Methylopila sp. Yamaguchi]
MSASHVLKPRPTSIATVTLSGGLREKLIAAAAVGFDGVEIFENDLLAYAGSPQDVGKLARDLGLTIVLYQPFRDFEATPGRLAANLDRAERKFDVMQQLGVDLLLACSNTQADAVDDDARAAADLYALADRAGARGLRIGYEALSWGRRVRRWARAWDIVRKAEHPALGLVLDSFHTLCVGDAFPGPDEAPPGDKIFFVQLADAPRLTLDPLSWSRHHRVFPGQGQLAVAPFLKAVCEAGYAGPLSLEVFNDNFRAAPALAIARDGLRSLLALQDEARVAGGAPLPAAGTHRGVAYLEFAVDQRAREAFAARFIELGFVHVGARPAKAVDLYRQGEIAIALNADPRGEAGGRARVCGPSLHAIGLAVDAPAAALARGRAFRCEASPSDDGVRDASSLVLRTPDRILIELLGPEGLGEVLARFDPIEQDQQAAGGLRRIDHLAQAIPLQEMDGIALFLTAVLGLSAQQSFEIADPHGLIESRALVSDGRALALPLNATKSADTMTGRRIARPERPAVHHIAFETDDIFAAVRSMRARGAATLSIPHNYYEDLGSRFTLDSEFVNRLERHSVMYDEDETGHFLHAYGPAFANGLFFEIVERKGYSGFGAPNAPVRVACQAHEYERECPT